MKMPEEKQFDVLMSQLHERYDALHKMRDRSMQFTLWILGLGLGLIWLLINNPLSNSFAKCLLTFAIILFSIFTFLFLRGINKGFNNTREIVVRIETLLGLYNQAAFYNSEPILPKRYTKTKNDFWGHFNTLYMFIIVELFTLISAIWLHPVDHNNHDISANEPNAAATQSINKK